jgi:hypothetical protein
MKNIILDSSLIKQLVADCGIALNADHKRILNSLKSKFGIEFLEDKQTNVRMFNECVKNEIVNRNDTFTFRFERERGNPFAQSEIVSEYCYLYYKQETDFILNWNVNMVGIHLREFNLNNGTEITVSDLVFGGNVEDIIMSYSPEKCDKDMLKRSKELHRRFTELFANMSPVEKQTTADAIGIYLKSSNFNDLHNHLVKNIVNV